MRSVSNESFLAFTYYFSKHKWQENCNVVISAHGFAVGLPAVKYCGDFSHVIALRYHDPPAKPGAEIPTLQSSCYRWLDRCTLHETHVDYSE